MFDPRIRIGFFSAVCLLALRLGIGWHFTMEGLDEIQTPNWSATPFLRQAKGPLAPYFHRMIPDDRGFVRLDVEGQAQAMRDYGDQVIAHYRLEGDEATRVEEITEQHVRRLQGYLNPLAPELNKYYDDWERFDDAAIAADRDVDFQWERRGKLEKETRAKAQPWLATVDKMRQQFQDDLLSRAVSDDAWAAYGPIYMPDPTDSLVDKVMPWVIFLTGIFLLVGLFTPIASLVGAGFLASVVATQPYWAPGAGETYYQWVELLGLLVVGFMGAGRIAGLDIFVAWFLGPIFGYVDDGSDADSAPPETRTSENSRLSPPSADPNNKLPESESSLPAQSTPPPAAPEPATHGSKS